MLVNPLNLPSSFCSPPLSLFAMFCERCIVMRPRELLTKRDKFTQIRHICVASGSLIAVTKRRAFGHCVTAEADSYTDQSARTLNCVYKIVRTVIWLLLWFPIRFDVQSLSCMVHVKGMPR